MDAKVFSDNYSAKLSSLARKRDPFGLVPNNEDAKAAVIEAHIDRIKYEEWCKSNNMVNKTCP